MTGSVASVKGFPGFGVYAASKAALRSFARTWLNELKGRNIRVNLLSPAPIATPMQDQVLTEEAKRMFESGIPRGKMGRPEEIAVVAVFLASDDSSFVNGVELSVDGGLSAIRIRAESRRVHDRQGTHRDPIGNQKSVCDRSLAWLWADHAVLVQSSGEATRARGPVVGGRRKIFSQQGLRVIVA